MNELAANDFSYLRKIQIGQCTMQEREAYHWLYNDIMQNCSNYERACEYFGEFTLTIPPCYADTVLKIMEFTKAQMVGEPNCMHDLHTGVCLGVCATYKHPNFVGIINMTP